MASGRKGSVLSALGLLGSTAAPLVAHAQAAMSLNSSGSATFVVCAKDAVNPRKCDFVGNGASDNLAIQAAINALPAHGGTVALSEGNFHIAAPIEIRGGVQLIGQGVNATALWMAHVPGPMIEYNRSDTEYWFYLADMVLSGGSATSGWGIDIGSGSGFLEDGRLQHIFVSSFPDGGIRLSQGWGWTLEHTVSEFNRGGYGLAVTGGNTTFIDASKFAQNANGVLIQAERTAITHTWVGSNTGIGINIDANNVRITDSNLNQNGLDGASPNLLVSPNTRFATLIGDSFFGDSRTVNNIVFSSGTNGGDVAFNTFQGGVGATVVDMGVGGPSGNKYYDNNGFTTESSGLAVIRQGSTSVVVNHGLSVTPGPSDCTFMGTTRTTNPVGSTWISNITAAQMTLNLSNDPGATGFRAAWSCHANHS